jgi:hypothetical protein
MSLEYEPSSKQVYRRMQQEGRLLVNFAPVIGKGREMRKNGREMKRKRREISE